MPRPNPHHGSGDHEPDPGSTTEEERSGRTLPLEVGEAGNQEGQLQRRKQRKLASMFVVCGWIWGDSLRLEIDTWGSCMKMTIPFR